MSVRMSFQLELLLQTGCGIIELDFKKAELKWNDIHTPHFIFLYKLPINMDYSLKH